MHWKVSDPAAVTLSVPVKAMLADVAVVEPLGALPIVVSGAVVSTGAGAVTVHVSVAGLASTLPAASLARTENVWSPTGTKV